MLASGEDICGWISLTVTLVKIIAESIGIDNTETNGLKSDLRTVGYLKFGGADSGVDLLRRGPAGQLPHEDAECSAVRPLNPVRNCKANLGERTHFPLLFRYRKGA